ncbi:MAG: glycosyltransferase family 4 protein [Bacteroidales bacterium]
MKVLMFGWEFPPHISGGLGTACYGLTRAMAQQDLEIIFIVPRTYGDEDTSLMDVVGANRVPVKVKKYVFTKDVVAQQKDIQYIEVDSKIIPYVSTDEYYNIVTKRTTKSAQLKKYYTTKNEGTIDFSGGYGTSLLKEVADYAYVAREIAQQYDFDIIHSHDWLTYDAGIAAKEVSKKPLVIHVHATEFDRSGMHVNQVVYDIERRGMHAADSVITVSNLTQSTVINHYGISKDKITTVYNGVDNVELQTPREFIKNTHDKVVTFLGRITFQKGPEYFLEAAAKVLKRKKNVKFVMAGSGDMLEKMMWRASELGISEHFYFTGFLRGDDVIHMLSISDVYVMPSVSEPFGISPLEAMRSNVPVIISKQSGVSEILKHAIKIDFWDVDSMADAIYGIVSYNGLDNMFKTFLKSEVESIKWDSAAYKVKQIYYKTLSKV